MTSIYGYLEAQSEEQLNGLYASHWCTLAVFQSLDPLSRHILLRLLFFNRTLLATELLEQWIKPTPRCMAELRSSVERMQRLHILGTPRINTSDGPQKVRPIDMNGPGDSTRPLVVSSFFISSLQHAISTVESTPWGMQTSTLPPLRRPPTAAAIESYAALRWNAVLHFLVGTSDAPVPDPKVIELLVSTHLLAPGGSSDEEVLFDAEGNVIAAGDKEDAGGVDAATAAARAGRSLTFDEIMELGGGAVHITRSGYEFLLKDTAVQLWTFVDEYLRTAGARGMATSDILAFLFEIGFCRLGEGYAVSALSATQLELLDDFSSFGLVFIPEDQEVIPLDDDEEVIDGGFESSAFAAALPARTYNYDGDTRRFYPSSLAIILTQPDLQVGGSRGRGDATSSSAAPVVAVKGPPPPLGPSGISGSTAAAAAADATSNLAPAIAAGGSAVQMRLVVEKNFKVYAYTNVDLHLALLALFAKIELRLPNLVVATLTRKSVLTAMEKGISAAQIRQFLTSRVHSVVKAAGLEVPENVVDQLFLWERERRRVTYRGGVLLTAFDSAAQFSAVLDHLMNVNGVIFGDENTRVIVCVERYVEEVTKLLRSLK